MRDSSKQFFIILAILLIIGAGILIIMVPSSGERTGHRDVVTGYGDKVAVVEVNGVITASEDIVRQIKKFRDDNGIRAILLRIESPGGGVVASHEIYDEVRRTREMGKPIVVSMGALAASGGYYIACGASKIVANPGTLTGSIGVISEFLQFDTLMHKIGISSNTIKSGALKDAGNPLRPMTPADKAYFQSLMDDVHRQFIAIVERERHLQHDSLVAIADGRVFTGEQAKALGLVDTLGTYEDGIRIAGKLAGIQGKPAVVTEKRERGGLIDLFLGSERAATWTSAAEEVIHRPILQYSMANGF